MTKEATLPGRRARLKAFMQLKTERRAMRVALGASLVLAAGAGLASIDIGNPPDPVVLGKGQAGVTTDIPPYSAQQPDYASATPVLELPEGIADDVADAAAEAIEAAAEEIGLGEASYYGDRFAGRATASGELFDPALLTAAHRTLPLGSQVRVTHVKSGESVIVKINDRGPFHGQRVIDLSKAAAKRLGMLRTGKAQVKLELLRRA